MADDMLVNTARNSPSSPAKRLKLKKMSWKQWLVAVLVVVLVVGGAWLIYGYSQLQKENKRLSNPTEAARVATTELVQEVSQLVELPTGETPTIATVSDAGKLKKQAFFAKSENGDKVLIYTQAKRAILYRPSTNKVIEIAPVNLGNNQSSSNGQ